MLHLAEKKPFSRFTHPISCSGRRTACRVVHWEKLVEIPTFTCQMKTQRTNSVHSGSFVDERLPAIDGLDPIVGDSTPTQIAGSRTSPAGRIASDFNRSAFF